MKLQTKREDLDKLDGRADEMAPPPPNTPISAASCTVLPRSRVCAQFIHSAHEKRGIKAEVDFLSALHSAKELVDVTGIEPVTPCLQNRFKPLLEPMISCGF